MTSLDGKKHPLSDEKVGMNVSISYAFAQVLSLQTVKAIKILGPGTKGTPLPIPSYSYAPSH